MGSFAKFVRTRASAASLGVALAVGAAASISLIGAPAAHAQVKESKDFVEEYQAAGNALKAKNYTEALSHADKAVKSSTTPQGKRAIAQIRISAYAGLKKNQELLDAIKEARQLGGLTPDQEKNLAEVEMGTYSAMGPSGRNNACKLTKDYVAKYSGTPMQYAYVADCELGGKDYKAAIADINKAIDGAKKSGKPPKGYYQILQRAYFDQQDKPNYYMAVERTYADYPDADLMKILIDRVNNEKSFNQINRRLDVARAYQAAKIEQKPDDVAQMGDDAISRGCSGESAKIFAPLEKGGFAGVKNGERFKKLAARAQQEGAAEATTGFPEKEKNAASAGKGDQYVILGQCYVASGQAAKGVEAINKGIAKGGFDPADLNWAKLNLGIAQQKAGQKAEAVKTWSDIKGDDGASVLAHDYALMSK